MATNQDIVTVVVQKVLEDLIGEENLLSGNTTGLFDSVNEAVEEAVKAQKRLIAMSLEQREKIVASIRKATLENNEKLSALAVQETNLGRFEDKIKENILCATKTPGVEDIQPVAKSGDYGFRRP